MKRYSFLIIVLTGLSTFANAQLWPPNGMNGNGSKESPWEITSASQLALLAKYLNDGNSLQTTGKYYKLMNDLDLIEYSKDNGWEPIGYYEGYSYNFEYCFRGNFNGNNKKIKNLTINRPSEILIGLFGWIYNANIQNIEIENCNITGSSCTGGLVSYSYESVISNCSVSGNIIQFHYNNKHGVGVGGLVGENKYSTITNCYSIINAYFICV